MEPEPGPGDANISSGDVSSTEPREVDGTGGGLPPSSLRLG